MDKRKDTGQTAMDKKKGIEQTQKEKDADMIEEIMRHLDAESEQGVYRMSITFDEESDEVKNVSHKCCNVYGRPASETVGLLDMYTDMNAGEPDRN